MRKLSAQLAAIVILSLQAMLLLGALGRFVEAGIFVAILVASFVVKRQAASSWDPHATVSPAYRIGYGGFLVLGGAVALALALVSRDVLSSVVATVLCVPTAIVGGVIVRGVWPAPRATMTAPAPEQPAEAPYRSAAQLCELCARTADAAALVPLGGLLSCASCRGGELQAALARWGLELRHSERERHPVSGNRQLILHPGYHIEVEVSHPTATGFQCTLGAESWTGDLEVPSAGGDRSLLLEPGFRAGVEEALQLAAQLGLGSNTVWLSTDWEADYELERLERLKGCAVALAIHLERWARSRFTASREPPCPAPI